MKSRFFVACCVVIVCTLGCQMIRSPASEKQNQELEAKVTKERPAIEYELEAKCSADAKNWFNSNFRRDQTTQLLTYMNHYNRAKNSCFIRTEFH
jgi:hypothetical protein